MASHAIRQGRGGERPGEMAKPCHPASRIGQSPVRHGKRLHPACRTSQSPCNAQKPGLHPKTRFPAKGTQQREAVAQSDTPLSRTQAQANPKFVLCLYQWLFEECFYPNLSILAAPVPQRPSAIKKVSNLYETLSDEYIQTGSINTQRASSHPYMPCSYRAREFWTKAQ